VGGAQAIAGATGLDKAVESVAEEAIVRAIESEAVDRALARLLRGPIVEEAVREALESEAVERALVDALDSDLVDTVWRRLLASEEAQMLVERIAEAPEVRSAISAQGVGFLEDLSRELRRIGRRFDAAAERVVRGILRRPRRLEPSDRAGAVTRIASLAIDAGLLNLALAGFTALLALAVNAVAGNSGDVSSYALVLGTTAWLIISAAYLCIFWTLTGQTPGMRLLGIRMNEGGERRLKPRTAVRRIVGMILAAIPLFLGFLGILTNDRRLGWQDRHAGTEVLYTGLESRPAPHSEA
jgi:uncharacterized RDD family membrane protein YckC